MLIELKQARRLRGLPLTVPSPSIPLGSFELTPVLDGFFTLDGGAMFGVVPKPLWEKVAPPDDRNRIRLAMRAWLVRGGGRTVLIDAGSGGKLDAKAADIYGFERVQSRHALADAERRPPTSISWSPRTCTSITPAASRPEAPTAQPSRAFPTRGTSSGAESGTTRCTRTSGIGPATSPENYVPLAEAGAGRLRGRGRRGRPGRAVRRTGGHTMHHQIVIIEAGGQTAIFAADLLPTAAHVPLPYIMGYDLYPMDTLAFKRGFLREAVEREYPDTVRARPGDRGRVYPRDGNGKVVDRAGLICQAP